MKRKFLKPKLSESLCFQHDTVRSCSQGAGSRRIWPSRESLTMSGDTSGGHTGEKGIPRPSTGQKPGVVNHRQCGPLTKIYLIPNANSAQTATQDDITYPSSLIQDLDYLNDQHLHHSVQALVTKYQGPGSFNNRYLCSQFWEPETPYQCASKVGFW